MCRQAVRTQAAKMDARAAGDVWSARFRLGHLAIVSRMAAKEQQAGGRDKHAKSELNTREHVALLISM